VKIKLDENLGPGIARLMKDAGHDVCLVIEQGLGGRSDSVLIEVCRAEGRCLVTLDMDFSHILNFPPSRYAGIAVLRLPEPISRQELHEAVRTLLEALDRRDIDHKLWIVSRGRVREYWSDDAET
jgi:predicted nuclease of predicted toxin-antitoxin system